MVMSTGGLCRRVPVATDHTTYKEHVYRGDQLQPSTILAREPPPVPGTQDATSELRVQDMSVTVYRMLGR
jgi:hypothetical protein